MLPLIAGIGSKLLSPGKTEDKNLAASKKKIKTEKFFDKKDKGGALVKTDSKKVKIKPSSALVKYQAPEAPKDKISDLSPSERKKSTGDELQSIIDEVKKLKSGLVKVRGLLEERKNSDLQSLVESRKVLQVEKKKRREDELEKKTPKEKKGGISLPKPKFSFFDSIVNFFTSILIGSLLNFLLANKNTIFKAFDDITKGFNNIFDVMRYAIISISTTMPKLIKSLASFGQKVFKGPAKLTGNLLKKLGGTIKNLLVKTGKALGSFVSGTFKNLAGLAGGAGTSATRATGVQQRRLRGGKPQLRSLPKPGTPKPTSPSTLKGAEKLFKPGGLKHFKKVSGVFKKVPFIGALIGIGIDLAMGERLDNAIVGAAGASLGAAIGGAIGTAVLPIPFVGTFLGGTIGAAVGDWAGKEIYKNLSGQIKDITPPSEEILQSSAYAAPGGIGPVLPGINPASVNFGAPGVQAATKYAQDRGYGKALTAGMLSTILNESGFNPYAVGDSGNSYGLFQFNQGAGRRQPFLDFLSTSGIPNPQALFTNPNNPDRAKYKDQVFGLTLAYMMEREYGIQLVRDYKNSNDLRTIMGGWEDVERYAGSQTNLPRNQRNNAKFKDRFAEAEGYLKNLDPNYKPTTVPTQPSTPVSSRSSSPVQGSPSTPLIGGGNATFGSTGRVSNAPNWVHGHFQDNNRNALLNNTFPIVKRLLEQGVPVVITGGGDEELNRNMSDSQIKQAISRGIDRHSNRTRGYFAVDVSVPEGTKVPVPLQDIRSGGNEGISGLIPGTNTFIGHLAPGSKSATAAELAQALRQQASYDQRGGTVVVPAPVIGGGGGQMIGGGGGGVLPVGMLQKDVLNSYYRAQLMGFLYKQG